MPIEFKSTICLPGLLLLSFITLLPPLTVVLAQPRGTIKTDFRVYPEPSPPKLPAAGQKFFDPTFGTEIMRVTDETNAQEGGTFYSYWPTFNCDNTRLLVRAGNDGSAEIFAFDPLTFSLGGHAPISRSPSGTLGAEGAIWSARDPDSLYGFVGMKIYAYHPSTRSYSLVADLTGKFPQGDFPWQPSMSSNDDVFAFSRRHMNNSGGSDYVGYAVYRRSDKSLILDQTIPRGDLDEVQIDKTGRWLIVKGEPKTTKGFSIRDLQNGGARKELGAGPPDYAPGHSDNGSTFVSGFNNYLNTIDRRDFANPSRIISELKLGNDWSQGLHISLLANDESWMLVSLYPVKPAQTPPGVFHNEIILVKTDGSLSVRRLVHHHSIYKDYWDTPRANISRDGRFVAFTSNWGGRSRRDLFVARIGETGAAQPKVRPRRVGTQ